MQTISVHTSTEVSSQYLSWWCTRAWSSLSIERCPFWAPNFSHSSELLALRQISIFRSCKDLCTLHSKIRAYVKTWWWTRTWSSLSIAWKIPFLGFQFLALIRVTRPSAINIITHVQRLTSFQHRLYRQTWLAINSIFGRRSF